MSKRQVSIVDELRRAIALAEKTGMTRGRIAAAAEMPRSQMTRIASGQSIPRLDTAERIAKVIGCKLNLTASVA